MSARRPFLRRSVGATACLLALAALATGAAEPPESLSWPSAVGEVVFDHRMHVDDVGAACETCHHQTIASALEVPHPGYFDDFWVDCTTCHDGEARVGEETISTYRCQACHPERTARGPKVEMPTVKVAIHESCWSCHDAGRGAEASASCGTCHRREAPVAGASRRATR